MRKKEKEKDRKFSFRFGLFFLEEMGYGIMVCPSSPLPSPDTLDPPGSRYRLGTMLGGKMNIVNIMTRKLDPGSLCSSYSCGCQHEGQGEGDVDLHVVWGGNYWGTERCVVKQVGKRALQAVIGSGEELRAKCFIHAA
ncbi:hypothetical protein BDFG_02018 [Blastomyces dermatitidis ATCC 26199]|nr:hypothetical protein BDFG_02018 [Blastomyces dermatitidis ATCC 26199]